MYKESKTLSPAAGPELRAVKHIVELDEASVAAVAGGINPQPLPPSHEPRLD